MEETKIPHDTQHQTLLKFYRKSKYAIKQSVFPSSANYFYKQPQISALKRLGISSLVVPFPPSANLLKNLGTSLAFPSFILYPRSAFDASINETR
jgi:hypothetical protein